MIAYHTGRYQTVAERGFSAHKFPRFDQLYLIIPYPHAGFFAFPFVLPETYVI